MTDKIAELLAEHNGEFPAYAWPGGYPIYYICADGGVLCPVCANKEDQVREALKPEHESWPDYDQWRIIAAELNFEDAHLTCDHCEKRIEAAYLREADIEELLTNDSIGG